MRSAADIEATKQHGQLGIIYHFQGTAPIEDDLDLIPIYKQLGVGMIQLAYNVRNRVGDGCEERTDCGLSTFGVRLIERLSEDRHQFTHEEQERILATLARLEERLDRLEQR